jgi:hypothetical protein
MGAIDGRPAHGGSMITYTYWFLFIAAAVGALYFFATRRAFKAALLASGSILLVGWGAYYFHFEQVFVKRFGGVMTISIPSGQVHIATTWKDDNLWVENYDPATNTCYFYEYSKGNLLEGKVVIKNCNPLLPKR